MRGKRKIWIIWIIVLAVILAAAAVAICLLSGEKRDREKGREIPDSFTLLSEEIAGRKITDEASAREAVLAAAEGLGYENTQETFGDCREDTVSGNTYYRFQQMYKGLPVYGRTLVAAADSEGNGLFLSGNYRALPEVDTQPEISEKEAVELAGRQYGEECKLYSRGLSVYSPEDREPELAWVISASSEEGLWECLLSAETGEILRQSPEGTEVQASCFGKDVDGNSREFFAEYENGTYTLADTGRNIWVYNANNSTLQHQTVVTDSNGKVYRQKKDGSCQDESGSPVTLERDQDEIIIKNQKGEIVGRGGKLGFLMSTANLFTEVEPASGKSVSWENSKEVTVMARASAVYDFWSGRFGRQGFDGKGGKLLVVYDDFLNGDTTNAVSYSNREIPEAILSVGTDSSLSENLISHEYTHCVVRSINNLDTLGEAGALGEAYADIFSEVIEEAGTGSCDWNFNGMRNIISPGEGASPGAETYEGQGFKNPEDISQANDYGGVHGNSTVISHAAYLMSRGIDGSSTYEALSMEEISRLFYETLFTMPSDCSFGQFRLLLQNMAELMYRQGRLTYRQVQCVSQAFFQTGVPSEALLVNLDRVSVQVYGLDEEPYYDYTLYIEQDNKRRILDGIHVSEEGIYFPAAGDYVLRFVDNAKKDNETVIAVRAVQLQGASELPVLTSFGISSPDQMDKSQLVTDACSREFSYQAQIYQGDIGGFAEEPATVRFAFPEIHLESEDAQEINREIYDTCSPLMETAAREIQENGSPYTSGGISYEWAENQDVLSLVVSIDYYPDSSGYTEYLVYNLSVSTGKRLDKESVAETAGFFPEKYRQRARQVLGSAYIGDADPKQLEENGLGDLFREQLKKTVSEKNIEEAVPYINQRGQLCMTAKVYSLAVSDYFWQNLNMEDFELNTSYEDYL